MKKFFSEFKDFVARGNVMDMAVGVIIGAAFKAIVDSLVGDIISPLLGAVVDTDFSALVLTFSNGVQLRYGAFLTALINFVLMAFVLFCVVKALNKLASARKKEEEDAEETTKICPYCKSEIPVDASRCPHCTSQV